ncbi:Tfp pilus assembly protein FimT/FimU [Thermodesulfobacteriota bacterium]
MIEGKKKFKRINGFTLIEVIVILLLIGLFSTAALSRYSSTNPFKLLKETETLKNHLYHARVRSMGDDVQWDIKISAGSYTLEKDGLTAPVNLPGEDSPAHSLSNGVTVTTGAGSTVYFDKWGSPGPADINIILELGTESRNITITKNTGFIE